jgi:glycosyltransferase involved in cell wall biosynthesis
MLEVCGDPAIDRRFQVSPSWHDSMSGDSSATPAVVPISPDEPRPLWSVMIPTYNSAEYLGDALRSVLAQAPGPDQMQIEVVDDCSDEDPRPIVDELARGRVGFHRQAKNVGHVRNFNTCIERARGLLVHILHGDDSVLDGFYRAMQQPFSDHPAIGAAFCRDIYVHPTGREITTKEFQPVSGIVEDAPFRLCTDIQVQPPAVVVRRATYECLGGYDTSLPTLEDLEMWVRIASSYPIWYEVAPLARYRRRPGSITTRSARSGAAIRGYRAEIGLVLEHLDLSRRREAHQSARRRCADWAFSQAHELIGAGDHVGALVQLREALISDWRHTSVRISRLFARRLKKSGGLDPESRS